MDSDVGTLGHSCRVQRRPGERDEELWDRAKNAHKECGLGHHAPRDLGNRMTPRQVELARALRADPHWLRLGLRTVRRRRQPTDPSTVPPIEDLPPIDHWSSVTPLLRWLRCEVPHARLHLSATGDHWECSIELEDRPSLTGDGQSAAEALASCVVALGDQGR